MDNSDFDYSYQYSNWHSDTPESLVADKEYAINFIKIHNILPRNNSDKVLEIGCGMGRFLLALQDFGYTNLKGIDIDESQINVAKKDGLDAKKQDGLDFLKENKEMFDVIYCLDVLEHIEKNKQLEFLKEINKHLSDNGFLVLKIPNALAPSASMFRYEDFTHHTLFTDRTINFLCHNAGMHYIVNRAQNPESEYIQSLKKPMADMYKREFLVENPILTPNIVSVVFKKEELMNEYLQNAIEIKNLYNIESFELTKFKIELTNSISAAIKSLVDLNEALRKEVKEQRTLIDSLLSDKCSKKE